MMGSDNFPVDKFISKSDSIFKDIPPQVLQFIENSMIERTFRKGQNIFLEGSYPAGIFYLKEGMVKKYKTDQSGKEHILYLCTPGDLLGYSALLCNEAYQDSAAALEMTKVGFVPKEAFLLAIRNSNDLMYNLLASLSHEFGVMVNSVTVFAHMTVRERLALTLLILLAKFKKKSATGVAEIILSREDLANMVGTATETLVRMLYELKNEGTIELSGKKIIVLQTRELVKMSKFY